MNDVNPLQVRQGVSSGGNARTATLQFVGLVVFTLIVVSSRWSGADIAIAFALLGMLIGRQRIRIPSPFWWGVGLVAWAYVTSIVAMSPAQAQSTAYERLKVMVIFLVVMNALRSQKQLRVYLLIILGAFMLYPARGALLNQMHGYTVFGRTSWNNIYANPNDLAAMAMLVMGVALTVATSRVERRLVRRGAAACAAILLLVILLTQSRGAITGLTIAFGTAVLRRLFKRPMIAVYITIAIVVGANVLPQSLWQRLSGMRYLTSTSTLAEADSSAAQRWQIQKTAWRIFGDHPLLGVGLGCYPLANDKYSPALGDRDTHDTYLNLASELGIPGLVLWLGLIASVLRRVRQSAAKEGSKTTSTPTHWLECAFYAVLIAGIFGSYSGITLIYLMLGVLWAATTLSVSSAPEASGMQRHSGGEPAMA